VDHAAVIAAKGAGERIVADATGSVDSARMNAFVRRAVQGFAFGLGFSLAAALAWWGWQQFVGLAGEVKDTAAGGARARSGSATQAAAREAIANAPATSVRVADFRLERRNGDVVALGTLHNDSETIARTVRLEAAYYDQAGRLVDLCGWYVAPALAPGEDKPFKISCGGTPDRPAPESASVRFRLVEAY